MDLPLEAILRSGLAAEQHHLDVIRTLLDRNRTLLEENAILRAQLPKDCDGGKYPGPEDAVEVMKAHKRRAELIRALDCVEGAEGLIASLVVRDELGMLWGEPEESASLYHRNALVEDQTPRG